MEKTIKISLMVVFPLVLLVGSIASVFSAIGLNMIIQNTGAFDYSYENLYKAAIMGALFVLSVVSDIIFLIVNKKSQNKIKIVAILLSVVWIFAIVFSAVELNQAKSQIAITTLSSENDDEMLKELSSVDFLKNNGDFFIKTIKQPHINIFEASFNNDSNELNVNSIVCSEHKYDNYILWYQDYLWVTNKDFYIGDVIDPSNNRRDSTGEIYTIYETDENYGFVSYTWFGYYQIMATKNENYTIDTFEQDASKIYYYAVNELNDDMEYFNFD